MQIILDRKGWQVEVASTVAEAFHLLALPPLWIVLDLMLPDGDGTAVLRKVRVEGLSTRVAVTTGSSDSSRLDEVTALRPDLFLTKPINLSDLFEGLKSSAR